MLRVMLTGALLLAGALPLPGTTAVGPVAHYHFDGTTTSAGGPAAESPTGEPKWFTEGLMGQALTLGSSDSPASVRLDSEGPPFDGTHAFSVQLWVRTVANADRRFVLLGQKYIVDNGLDSQKQAGWVFYASDGTWAWNAGSGDRRITYERDNGEHMPLNDGRWHQLTMTFDPARSVVRLFYDGDNKVSYNVADSEGFAFGSTAPLVVGWETPDSGSRPDVVPAIPAGARQIQKLVDAFGGLGVGHVEPDELVHLMVDPRRLYDEKTERATSPRPAPTPADWERVEELEKGLMANPYTVHQALEFMKAAPAMKIYALVDGKVVVNRKAALAYSQRERLHPPEVDVDELTVWADALSPEEVLASYAKHFKPAVDALEPEVRSLTVGVWNIWHGGKHFTLDEHGWDSRVAVAEILKREGVDVVLMQETYSSGDFIAAELGYTLATTVDWDYLNQGSNISVLSRFPVREVYVQGDSPFMNVATKLVLSDTQELYAMSNWYGMRQFPAVFDFHEPRFRESDTVPTVFGGDFNAVPHTDGGDSPASKAMLEAGFTDAFRSLHPDTTAHPGATHRNGRRIDQLYYKGAGLRNTSTRLVSTWPTGFPSDHYLIVSTFEVAAPTPEAGSRPPR